MNKFKLVSSYSLKADQISASKALVEGIKNKKKNQVLLGATGTGKTFTIASVIEAVNKPTIVFAPNKTLAGQLYSEFKALFPENRVEYFVSNFDFYQPEAYIPKTDTYIQKTADTNKELDMLRLSAYNSMLERKDTIVVASVACIYASSDPDKYRNMFFTIKVGEKITRQHLIERLVNMQYQRNNAGFERGTFKVIGDSIEITPGHSEDFFIRVEFFDDEIDRIVEVESLNRKTINAYMLYHFFPAQNYARDHDEIKQACDNIEKELQERLAYFKKEDKQLEYERLSQRTSYDLEALREFGFCSGIENYSMHIDFRSFDQRPYNLFDYFDDDFLLVIDESHVSIPQIDGMFKGDRARKKTLVDYGFRLPSALANRPMTFEEFENIKCQRIFISATPGNYELDLVDNKVIEQINRPTGLLDPIIEVRKKQGLIDDLLDEIKLRISSNERVIITTIKVEMAEKLKDFLTSQNIKTDIVQHEIKTLQRIETLLNLRKGKIDVLVGVNLLREGLDLPEVSLVCIIDADVEGIFRSYRSLIQTIGRAARNANGKVIMYADKISDSMKKAIDETKRRRSIQEAYNKKHGIIPKTVIKEISEPIHGKETKELSLKYQKRKRKDVNAQKEFIEKLRTEMKQAAKDLDFERAMELRDIIMELEHE